MVFFPQGHNHCYRGRLEGWKGSRGASPKGLWDNCI